MTRLSADLGSVNAASASGTLGVQTHDAWQWSFVVAAIAVAVALAALAWRRGRSRPAASAVEAGVARLESGLEETMRLPAWAAAGVTVGLWSLAVALVGFEWDVAWHADTGRDKELFTVPHMLIVVGLLGIFAAAVLAIALASRAGAEVGWRIGRFRVPYSSLPLLLVALGALVGFPLDDAWHAAFGVDVTMWSPTHLLMIGGASLSTIPLWLMLREAGADRLQPSRWRWALMGGVVLVGLSTFQLEYDLGIPQWQLFLQPVLMAAAMSIGLVMARVASGPGGALAAALGFLALRGILALVIGPGLHDSLPRFPLYLGGAVAVEALFLLGRRLPTLALALLAGALVATVGLAAEWAWTSLWFVHPWSASLLPYFPLALLAALAGAILGLGMGRVLAREPAGLQPPVVALALLLLALAVGWHLPDRHADPARATLDSQPLDAARLVPDRDGLPTVRQDLRVAVALDPASAAQRADIFEVVAWQGHAPVVHRQLVETSPGRYLAQGAVPSGGDWKSLVFLVRGDTVEAVPVSFPPDPAYGQPAVSPPTHRTEAFVPASRLLMREFHAAFTPVAVLAFGAFAFFALAWVSSLALAYWAVGNGCLSRRAPRPAFKVALG